MEQPAAGINPINAPDNRTFNMVGVNRPAFAFFPTLSPLRQLPVVNNGCTGSCHQLFNEDENLGD